jgi:hypothetical protein
MKVILQGADFTAVIVLDFQMMVHEFHTVK